MLSWDVVLVGNIWVILFTVAGITATIIQGPSNTVAEIGGEVKLDCAADYVPINFWVLSKSNIGGYLDIVGPGCSVNSPFDDHYSVESLGGGTTCNLIVFNITMEQAGVYECLDAGSYRFFSILTVIDPSPNIYANTTNGVVANETVQIECRYFYNGSLSPAPTLRPYIYWTDVDGQNVTSFYDSTTDYSVVSLLAVTAGQRAIMPYTAHVYLQLIPTFTNDYANNIPSVNLSTRYPIIEVLYPPGSMSTLTTTDICVYKPENLTCTADANPAAEYTWVDLSNNATTAGAIKSIISGGQYQCIAYNNIRSVTYWVTITATEASCYSVNNMTISGPSCTNDTCYCVGNQSATITCVAYGFPGPTYEWSYGNEYLGSNQTIEAMYDGIYRCTASNVYGGNIYQATVSVDVSTCRITGMITQGPSNAVAETGEQVELNCTGDAPIVYWFLSKNGTATDQLTIVGPGCSTVNAPFTDHYSVESFGGGTTCNLIVFNITMNQGGVYKCFLGINSLSSILTVIDSLPIMGVPVGVVENDSVEIACIYFFDGSLSPAPTLRPYIYWTDFYGQNVSSFFNHTWEYEVDSKLIVTAGRQDIMPYTAHVYLQLIPTFTDGYANNTPTVNISPSYPIIEVLYSPGNISIRSTLSTTDNCVYKPENLTCTADANPPAEYNWVDVSNNAATAGAVKSITSGGQYMCIAFNNIKGITHMVTKTTTEASCYPVTINSMTISGSSCTSNTCYCVGNQSATITCMAQGFPGPTYEWSLGNAYLGSNQTIQAMYNGIYHCTASNEYGENRNNATLSVKVLNCKTQCQRHKTFQWRNDDVSGGARCRPSCNTQQVHVTF